MSTKQQIQHEFDHWVTSNHSEWMQYRHQFLLEGILTLASLQSHSRVLDLCCGEGWAVHQVSQCVRQGIAVGLDLSARMIDKATKGPSLGNVLFLHADVSHLPLKGKQFSHIYSIESLYYIDNIENLFDSLYPLLIDGGKLLFALSYFKENPHTEYWQKNLPIDIYNRSTQAYVDTLAHAGFNKIKVERLFDPSTLPQQYEGRWFQDTAHLDAFRTVGSLLLCAEK